MGIWATVDLKHSPKITWEIEAEMEMYAGALASIFFPSTKGQIHELPA